MKSKNLYYQIMFQRTNMIKMLILSFFLAIASWPRMVLEVFIRKSFGERYFSFSTAITIAIVLCISPFGYDSFHNFFNRPSVLDTIGNHPSWYLFIVVFLYFAWRRKKEVRREPGVFDFAKFSLYNGDINPAFRDLEIPGIPTTRRIISTWYEPAFFLIIGLILRILDQGIGVLLFWCSICYSLSYAGAYYMGDQFIMDKIDEMIFGEEMVDAFVNDLEPENTKGVEWMGDKPKSHKLKKEVVKNIIIEEEPNDVF